MTRLSTARPTSGIVIAYLKQAIPSGSVLNLGAGQTGFHDDTHVAINVDYASPANTGEGHFTQADALRLPFAESTFNGCLLKDVIEHHPAPVELLHEVRRVSKIGAVAVITAPRAVPRAVWDDPTHIRGFTARAILQAVELAGWRPLHPPRRWGSVPGAGRFELTPHIEAMLRIPGIGHRWGTNWVLRVVAQ